MMKRKLMASLLTGILVAGMTVNGASAAGAAGTTITGDGSGHVYSPEDIVDVVVPTSFKIAFNPLKVNIPVNNEKGDAFGLSGSAQILSGTYAIQNRSTIPVNVSASFKITGDATAQVASAKDVAAYDAQTDLSKVTLAQFSLDLVTTAKGTVQNLASDVQEKSDTAKMRQDAAAAGVKITKASTKAIPLTNIDKAAATSTKDINFMLAAGPYSAKYDSTSDKVIYQADAKGTFDAVAFSFTGTTTTNAAKWAAVKTAPKVAATYTLTESSESAYAAQAFDPYSKAVTLKTGDANVQVSSSVAGSYIFKDAPTVTKTPEGDIDNTKSKVTVLNLAGNSKAESKTFEQAGITVTHDESSDTYKASIAKGEGISEGFYLFTIGKEAFTVEVK